MADPSNLPPGCSFEPRYEACVDPCDARVPDLLQMPDGRYVACHRHPEEDADKEARDEELIEEAPDV